MSTPLIIVKPLEISEAMLTATNITEADYAAWNGATNYAIGDRVISGHKIYERMVAGVRAGTPSGDSVIKKANGKRVKRVTTAGGSVATYAEAPADDASGWLEVGPTNRWAMFDTSISTQSTRIGNIEFTITPGKVVNSVGLLGLDATSVRIRMIDPVEGTVYDKTTTLQTPPEANWYSYFFDDVVLRDTFVATDLPNYGSAAITITVDAGSGTAALGACLIGRSFEVGDDETGGVHAGAKVGINDFSKKEYDTFGNALLLKRAFAKRASFDMLIPNTRLDAIAKALAEVRATPTLWIASERYDSTVIYGLYKDFDITIAYAAFSQCSLTLEGLTE